MFNESIQNELTEEEERLRRIWRRSLEEIRKINEVYSNPQYGLLKTKTLAGNAYYNALLKYAWTTKFSKLPDLFDTELYEAYAMAYKHGAKRLEREFYFLLMRKLCDVFQDKESSKSKELAKRDKRARTVVLKRYFECKTYSTIEYEMQMRSGTAKRLCEIAIQILNTNF